MFPELNYQGGWGQTDCGQMRAVVMHPKLALKIMAKD